MCEKIKESFWWLWLLIVSVSDQTNFIVAKKEDHDREDLIERFRIRNFLHWLPRDDKFYVLQVEKI